MLSHYFFDVLALLRNCFLFWHTYKFDFFDLTDKDLSCDKTVKEYMYINQITITSCFRNGTIYDRFKLYETLNLKKLRKSLAIDN